MSNHFQANQYEADPRQAEFLKAYLNPKSATFSNCLQSGLKVGYSKEYSENLLSLMPDWLSVSLDDGKMLIKVKKNLEDFLDNADDRLRFDATKFVGETIGKARYSKRTELTGPDGIALIPSDEERLRADKALTEYLYGATGNTNEGNDNREESTF